MLSLERIDSLLAQTARLGWHFEPVKQSGIHRTFLDSREGQETAVAFSPTWIYLWAPIPITSEVLPRWHWYENLLRATDRMYLTKYALIPKGDVTLRVELPVRHFNPLHFEDALTALVQYRCQLSDASQPSAHQEMPPDPSPLSTAQIKTFFQQLSKEGWQASESSDSESWKALYRGRLRLYQIYVTFTGNWIYFQSPITNYAGSDKTREALNTYLLELNDRIYWAKFCTCSARTETGDITEVIVLTIEAPANGFNFGLFREAGQTLVTYLERYFFEINLLAKEPELGSLVLGESPNPAWFRPPHHRVKLAP